MKSYILPIGNDHQNKLKKKGFVILVQILSIVKFGKFIDMTEAFLRQRDRK